MSDNTTEKPINTDAELARDVDRRLDAQENAAEVRVGGWVLSEEASSGNLVANHASGSGVKLADKPPEGADPDTLTEPPPPEQIPEHKCPRIKVKGGVKNAAHATLTTYNVWNTVVDFEEPAGTWTHDASSFTIPEDGDYDFLVYMPWQNTNAGTARSLEIRKNGTIVDIDKRGVGTGEMYTRIVNSFRCVAGDVFTVVVWQDSGGTISCGGANFGDAWAQMVIKKIADSDYQAHPADGSPYVGTAPTATT